MRRQPISAEDGNVVVTAIVLLFVMLGVALASYAMADTGQQRTLDQRQRETSLNITEGVMYGQGFTLASLWPGNATQGALMPATCTETVQTAALQRYCPTPSTMASAQGGGATANFQNVDATSGVTWKTRVRDNGGPLAGAYVPTSADLAQTGTNVRTGAAYTCAAPCKYDANGDQQLWVQAQTIVKGKPRNVVSLLKREVFAEPFPRSGVIAGSFSTTNNGNKTIIDVTGSQVVVRCTSTGPSCTDYQGPGSPGNKQQITPEPVVRDPVQPNAMSTAQVERFKAVAEGANPTSTYYTSCPPTLEGSVVFIDVPATTNCNANYGGTYNSATAPGIVIMPRGTLTGFKGTYYGILYLRNEQNSTGTVLALGANSQIFGGIAIDGPGHLDLGQASGPRPTVVFKDTAYNGLASFGTTGLVQNTWRELPVQAP